MNGPIAGPFGPPIMLDGVLSWAAAMHDKAAGKDVPPLTREHAPDLELPFERWESHGTWGWKASQGVLDLVFYSATEMRRKPATREMSMFTKEKKHHAGLGPQKARDTTVPTQWAKTITWEAVTTNPDLLMEMLLLLTNIGAHAARGLGAVGRWEVLPSATPEGWKDRDMPAPGVTGAFRPPYHHHTRRVQINGAD